MRIAACLVLALAAAGCQRKEAPAPHTQATTPAGVAPATSHAAASNGIDSLASDTLSGRVLETKDSAGYTYVRLETADGERWGAVRQASLKVGATASISGAMVMRDFESKTLHRKFDRIVFGSLASGGESRPPAQTAPEVGRNDDAMNALAAPHAAAARGAEDSGDVRVLKAVGADAKTVAEVFVGRASLKDRSVTVRAKVVKSNSGILGRNWIHLRDGSGSAGTKDSDLTVTSLQTAAVGDVVTVKGTIHVDRDLGMGYVYPVIMEDATVSR
jgi:hypothetical protein